MGTDSRTRHRPGLFEGTAQYYARFRPPYPAELFDSLIARFGLDETTAVVDLGCGVGNLSIPLAKRGVEVWAIDPDPEMLSEARAQERHAGVSGVHWLEGSDADLEHHSLPRKVKLCTMGASFHWMDRRRTLARLALLVADAGGVAIVSAAGSVWGDDEADRQSTWASVVKEVITDFLGPDRRAGGGIYRDPAQRHEDVLRESPFAHLEFERFVVTRRMTVSDIIGLQLSTSYASPAQLGDRRDAFVAALTRELEALEPAGAFRQDVVTDLIVATRD